MPFQSKFLAGLARRCDPFCRSVRRCLAVNRSDAGFTLVELLVASAMGVIVLGGLGTMMISAMRSQPEVSKRSQNISTARWVLERMTREIRNGVKVDPANATASSVSFETYVRHTTCGSTTELPSTSLSIKCEVTYTCTTTKCSRIEAAPEITTGAETTIFSGINSSNVFSYSPSPTTATYIGITLRMPNPSGPSALTVSDGASLRNAVLAN
jgi:prepilin-type N-terminal cleavage/methylation domain-containing protein